MSQKFAPYWWKGNFVEEGKWISDTVLLLDSEWLQGNEDVSMPDLQRMNPERADPFPQAKCDKMIADALKSAGTGVEFYPEAASLSTYAQELVVWIRGVAVRGVFWEWLHNVLCIDECRMHKEHPLTKPIVLCSDGEAVGLLMPMDRDVVGSR